MAARELFKEFCVATTIHGVRYFTEQRRHWSERSPYFKFFKKIKFQLPLVQTTVHFCFANHRVFWIAAFSVSICLCGASIQNIWEKWTETPLVMSLSEKELTVSEIPFPMVTVCPGLTNVSNFIQYKFHLIKYIDKSFEYRYEIL